MSVFGFLVCEWLQCFAVLLTYDGCSWLFREWEAAITCNVLSQLMMFVHVSLVCEWLQCVAMFQAYWWYLTLALQFVSGCSALTYFKLTDDVYSWLSSLWVAAVPCCCLASLLMMPVFGSSGSEWLQYLAMPQAYWWYLFLALQFVCGSSALLYFKPTNDACPWFFRKWVAAVPYCVSSLLMIPVIGSPVCEWLQQLVVFQADS